MATIQGQLLGPTLFPNRAIEKCENWDFSRSRIWRVKCGRASNCGCRENISSSFLATHQPHHTGHTPATLYWPHTSHTIHQPHQTSHTPTTTRHPLTNSGKVWKIFDHYGAASPAPQSLSNSGENEISTKTRTNTRRWMLHQFHK